MTDHHSPSTAHNGGPDQPNGLRSLDPFMDCFAMPTEQRPAPTAVRALTTTSGVEACRCDCGCTRPSDVPSATVVSPEALTFIRCQACFEAGHTKRPGGTPRALAPGQEAFIGERTGQRIVVAKPHEDDSDAAHDALIREEIRRTQWTQATERWLEHNVPERFRQPIDEPLPPQISDILARLAAKDGSHYLSMLSLGPFGTGKTWMAYVLARKVVEQQLIWPAKIRILKERALLEPLVTGDQWDRHKILEKTLDRDRLQMLIVDDVGTWAGGKPEERISAYNEIVDWFYVNNRPLVMTSNLPLGPHGGPFAQAIGGAAWDRLKNMLGPHGVLFRDESQRKQQAEAWEASFQRRDDIA